MKQFLRRIALLSALTALLLACADSIVDRGDAYKVWETKPLEYRYEVYAASGKRIDRGEVGSVPPQFVMIDGDVLKMTLGHGTNAYDCVYYRLPEGLKSNAFPNAIAECGDYVLYMGVENDRAVLKAEKPFDRTATPYRYEVPDLNPSFTFDSVSVDSASHTVSLRYVSGTGTDQNFRVTLPQ